MSTNTPDLALRQAVAEKLGWTEVGPTMYSVMGGIPSGAPKVGGYYHACPEWELSLDACMRDAVPWAKERGWRLHFLCQSLNGTWHCIFDSLQLGRVRGMDSQNPAKAFCLAFVQLP